MPKTRKANSHDIKWQIMFDLTCVFTRRFFVRCNFFSIAYAFLLIGGDLYDSLQFRNRYFIVKVLRKPTTYKLQSTGNFCHADVYNLSIIHCDIQLDQT